MDQPKAYRRWRHLKRGTTYMELFRDVVMGDADVPEGAQLSLTAARNTIVALTAIGEDRDYTIATGVTLQSDRPPFGAHLVVYIAEVDRALHARLQTDFLDGRFEEIPHS